MLRRVGDGDLTDMDVLPVDGGLLLTGTTLVVGFHLVFLTVLVVGISHRTPLAS